MNSGARTTGEAIAGEEVGGSLEVASALGDSGEGLRMGWWRDAGREEAGTGTVKVQSIRRRYIERRRSWRMRLLRGSSDAEERPRLMEREKRGGETRWWLPSHA